jgi:cytochrome c556
MKYITFLFTLLTVMAGCSAQPKSLPDSGRPALHAIHDSQLHQLMAEMNHLMFERMRTELEIDQERRKKSLKIAKVASEMSNTITDVIDTLPRLALSPNEQTTFLTLADTLRSRVKTLEEQAHRNYIDAIPETLEQIAATCTGCHHLFRTLDHP